MLFEEIYFCLSKSQPDQVKNKYKWFFFFLEQLDLCTVTAKYIGLFQEWKQW